MTVSETIEERVTMRNPTTASGGLAISRAIYEPVRHAILESLDEHGGLPPSDLAVQVERRTPNELWKNASTIWFTTTVKLHLEATGLVERKGSPPVVNLTKQGRDALH